MKKLTRNILKGIDYVWRIILFAVGSMVLLTLLKSRKVWPEGHHNLDITAGYCGYDMTNHHHALADAEACVIIAMQIL